MRPIDVTVSAFAFTLTVVAPTLAKTPQSGTVATAPHSTTAAPSPSGASSASASAKKTQAFRTETAAKSVCGSQPVVWAHTSSRVLHAGGSQYYGKTKRGAYMCENTAEQAGYHMANN